jgi:uncharacterized protein with HEPN domain
MYDRDLLIEVLTQILKACRLVLQRFEPVRSVEDFTGSPAGMEKLDAICMQLIAIGESLKKVDTITEGGLLAGYTAIDWKKAKGMRDILSHHYFDVNAEAIFDVCENKMPLMERTIKQIIQDLPTSRQT